MLMLANVIWWLAGILSLIVFIFTIFVAWRISPLRALLLLIPFVNVVVFLHLLFTNWQEMSGVFFAGIGVGLLKLLALWIAVSAMPIPEGQMANSKQTQQEQMMERIERDRQRMMDQMNQNRIRPNIPKIRKPDLSFMHNRDRFGSSGSTRNTPPPRPDEPIFVSGQLVTGLSSPSGAPESWPVLTVPDLDLTGGKALGLYGYQLLVPDVYKIDRIEPLPNGNGMQWWIAGGQLENGRPVELKVTVVTLPQKDDGRVYAPSWSELLGQAGLSRADHKIEYGRLGAIPFIRCANKLVKSGHGVGKVRYLGLPSPENPQRIEIEFATDPAGFGRAHALTCEAIARSLTRSERVMMPGLGIADVAAVSSKLVTPSTAGTNASDWQVRGPFALAISDHSNTTCSRWTQDGNTWRTTARFNGARGTGLEIRLQPDDDIPYDRIRPIAMQGPLRADSAVCAYGGEASYVKLWNDAVFARIEHAMEQDGESAGYRSVSYHGYLNQHRLDITLTNRIDSEITLAELEDTLLRSRLATVPEIVDQADWLKEVLAEDQPAFLVANGVDATKALLLDERGQVAVSPQYDLKKQRMFQVYPSIDDADLLADYEQWTSVEDSDELLGKVQTLGEIVIQPIKELRASHRSKQLSWQARTKAGTVGMTVHLEALKESDRDIQTPIVDVAGRLRVRLGRRVIQPSQTPEVSYRELQNLRIWKVNVPASARQEIARCHYLAIVPDHMIVISVSYQADRPEQLEAFDASVATLLYREGKPLERETTAQ